VIRAVSSENVELVQHLVTSFNAGGAPLVDLFWAEDAELWPAPGFPEGGPFRGRDQIRSFFDGLREGWEPGSFSGVVRELAGVGDKVLVTLEWRAIGAASGIETSSEWMAVYTIRGGRVVRLEFFSDRDAAIRAAGLK
jgi:ketosteroid isomerase-like protein